MNMRSSSDDTPTAPDDRTTRARIRDAAIGCFAEHGVADTTVRKVATATGVSPGLVMHHFGSMEGLRLACDEHVAAVIRRSKDEALSTGPQLDLFAALRTSDFGPIFGYLARVLAEDSPVVAKLVDDLVTDAEVYLEHGIESGMLRSTDDPRGRAVIVTVWLLGGLVLHHHIDRLLGVDLTNPNIPTDPAFVDYLRPAMEVIGSGLYTEEFAAELREAFASRSDRSETTQLTTTTRGQQ